MPVWLELLVLLMLTYAVGIGIGWAIWGRTLDDAGSTIEKEDAG